MQPSSRPLACHVLHCCSVLGILKWLDLRNKDSPPGERVVSSCLMLAAAAVVTAGVSVAGKHDHSDRIRQQEDVRKKSHKSRCRLPGSAANHKDSLSSTASLLIELSTERKLGKRVAQLTVSLIAFAIFLHLVCVLLGAPFTR